MRPSRTKLGELERNILVAANLRASEPARVIAKILKVQERTVRYYLHRMEQRGIIRRVPFINVYPLGLRYFNIYFSFSATERSKRLQIVNELKHSSKVSWVGELGGEFNIGFALILKTPEECLDFIEELSSRVGQIFLQKEIVSHRSLTVFPHRYLAPNVKAMNALGYGAGSEKTTQVAIDPLDNTLLKLLSVRGSMPIRTIAQTLGVPHSTIALRIKRLTELKVLAGEWFTVDVNQLGYQTLKLLVEARETSLKFKQELYGYVEQRPEFVYLIECFGKWDFEIGFDVPTDGSISLTIDDLTERFGSTIASIKIVPMFKVLKWSLYP
jgi:DNA-binding Lrp family transcriptional regulator